MLKISESYLIGVDLGLDDELCITIVKRGENKRLDVVKTVFGEEAEELYEKMTGSPINKQDKL